MNVDLKSYIFEVIAYDPTENPRGVVTADEWNTILSLLKSASNYTSKALQEIVSDLYTAHELSSTEPGASGAALIGVEPIAGLSSTMDLKGNVSKALKELVSQIQNIVLGDIPPDSITSDKFSTNLNFRGEKLTFNNIQLLTEGYIKQAIDTQSSVKDVASAKAIFDSLLLKQDNILIGEDEPTEDLEGNIYIQLENEAKTCYTKEETNLLLDAKQTKLKAGNNITISDNVISANVPKVTTTEMIITTGQVTAGKQSTDTSSFSGSNTFYKSGYYPVYIGASSFSGSTAHYVSSGTDYRNTRQGQIAITLTVAPDNVQNVYKSGTLNVIIAWFKMS